MQKLGHRLLLFLICPFLLTVAQSQNEVPIHPVDGEFIKEWLVIGPFIPDNLQKDFLVDAGGEANIKPEEGDAVITRLGDTLTWKSYRTHRSIIDLYNLIGNYQNTVAYAYCNLKSITEGKNQILLGSDDGAAIWINGKRVYFNPSASALFLDDEIFEVDLIEGNNRCLVKISQGTGNWGFAMRVLPHNLPVVVPPKFFMSSYDLKNDIYLPNSTWKYHPGDNKEWARSDYDDSSWEFVSPELLPDELPESGWPEVGWFRFHFAVDSSLINKPLGLYIWQAGTSQIYLDGKLLFTIGEQNDDWIGIPKVLSFDENESHVIAVRYANSSVEYFNAAGYSSGFLIRLGNTDSMTEDSIRRERTYLSFQIFFTSLSLAIGLLHLILFAFLPSLKQNLFFALFLFAYAATIYFDYQILLSADIGQQLFSFRMHIIMLPFWILLQLRFVYSIFYKKLPKQFGIISLIVFCLGALAFYNPQEYFALFGYAYLAIYVEIPRVIVMALHKKREGTWIIGMAYLVFFIFGLLDTLMDKGILVSLREIENPYAFGSIGFFIAMSVYLAHDFAGTNKKLAEKELEQKLLEAENARQAKELDEARQLQLSMLPKELPQLPYIEIGVLMKTATEVGGDYYDFKLHDDGTLTAAIGDATGHGMQAGTMVSVIKGLFVGEGSQTDILPFFKKCSLTIKKMHLKNLYMAMMLINIKDYKMTVSSAGIPPIYIYRNETKSIEEIIIKGMPLGGPVVFPYELRETSLEPGDTVLLMSDGFPELFNDKDEMLDYPRVKKIFEEAATKSADEITAHLFEAGERWRNGRPQDDDITFVVLKVKNNV